MLHFGKWNWGNSTKKYYGKFEKMAFRKSHEKGVEAQKFFPIERKIWGRTTQKTKFLPKILAQSEGGGRQFLQKLQKFDFSDFRKFLKQIHCRKQHKILWLIFCNFCRNFWPPPLWKSQNFKKKSRFLGRSTSDFSLNLEEFLNFDTLSGPSRKATFSNFP